MIHCAPGLVGVWGGFVPLVFFPARGPYACGAESQAELKG